MKLGHVALHRIETVGWEALVDANRTSELAALDLLYKSSSPEGVTFSLAALTNNRKVGATPRKLFFGGFPHDKSLCAVSCFQEYTLYY